MTAGSIAVPNIMPLRVPVSGKSKHYIDSNTKIEITTDTNDTTIFYTINGIKPEPFRPYDGTPTSTLKYIGPFTLPAGTKTVKAVAVSKCGTRESNIVSKTFHVEYCPATPGTIEDDAVTFQEQLNSERQQLNMKRTYKNHYLVTKSAWTKGDNCDNSHLVQGSDYKKPGTGPRHLGDRLGHGITRPAIMDHNISSKPAKRDLSTSQCRRIQRQTDYLNRCPSCLADRPTDPFAKYCHVCGADVPPLPQTHKLSQPEPGQLGTCVFCHSVVPFNTTLCLVCEAPIPVQNQPQASIKLTDKLVCTLCGTMNPSNLISCLTCDSQLPTPLRQRSALLQSSTVPSTQEDGDGVRCSSCQRINNQDARFCDWCGAKPGTQAMKIVCSLCHAANHPHSNFCAACGTKMEAPLRIGHTPSSDESSKPRWITVPLTVGSSFNSAKYTNTATQTVGLYYPSERELRKKLLEEEKRLNLMEQMSDKRPVLTAVSPGRGYWRKQMDHICGHLKAYAANDAEFRALIGEPKMGRLLTASVHENGYELTLTVSFALRGSGDKYTGDTFSLPRGAYLSSHTLNDSYSSQSDLASEISTDRSLRKKKLKKTRKLTKKNEAEKIKLEDKKLLKEVGIDGEGRPLEVQRLIDEGADPSCINKDGVPLLHICSRNKHADCIPVIVQAGYNVNSKGPSSMRGNSALHEAVLIGPAAVTTVDALLGCGADIQRKNDKGETAIDLAVKSGCDSLITRLTAALGQNQLEKSLKLKTDS